jgi:membrane-associated phospholipid phosphatase
VLEVVDTITERSTSYRTLQPPGLINKYAALPSLHFGWNLLVGIVLWRVTRSRAIRAFAVVMPVAMAFAVVATGNHYVVDVLAGGVVALAGLAGALALPRVRATPAWARRQP